MGCRKACIVQLKLALGTLSILFRSWILPGDVLTIKPVRGELIVRPFRPMKSVWVFSTLGKRKDEKLPNSAG
jgi:hypothetical protein